jgi:hypothetical protein
VVGDAYITDLMSPRYLRRGRTTGNSLELQGISLWTTEGVSIVRVGFRQWISRTARAPGFAVFSVWNTNNARSLVSKGGSREI